MNPQSTANAADILLQRYSSTLQTVGAAARPAPVRAASLEESATSSAPPAAGAPSSQAADHDAFVRWQAGSTVGAAGGNSIQPDIIRHKVRILHLFLFTGALLRSGPNEAATDRASLSSSGSPCGCTSLLC